MQYETWDFLHFMEKQTNGSQILTNKASQPRILKESNRQMLPMSPVFPTTFCISPSSLHFNCLNIQGSLSQECKRANGTKAIWKQTFKIIINIFGWVRKYITLWFLKWCDLNMKLKKNKVFWKLKCPSKTGRWNHNQKAKDKSHRTFLDSNEKEHL